MTQRQCLYPYNNTEVKEFTLWEMWVLTLVIMLQIKASFVGTMALRWTKNIIITN